MNHFSSVNGDHAEVFRKAEEVIERVVAHIDGSREICKAESKSRYTRNIYGDILREDFS